MKLTLHFKTFCLLTISLCHLVYTLDCPPKVYVELGTEGIISCQTLNNGDVYWYKGNLTTTSPIVILENGQKEISHERSPYDIDDEGSLIIKNLEEQYCGLYSVVNFYDNDKHDTGQVKVEIAVKPHTMCPVISGCNDCNHCVLTKPDMGNISCSLGWTRPQLHLNIITDSKNRINVIRNVSVETYDPLSDTWNATTTIEYSEWYDCTSPLHLRCITRNEHPFELSNGVAHLEPGLCPTTRDTPFLEETGGMHIPIVVIGLSVASVVVLVTVALGLVFFKRRAFQQQPLTASKEDHQMESQPFVEDSSKVKGTEKLIAHLEGFYRKFTSFDSLLNEEEISPDALLKGIKFSFTENYTDSPTIISSEDLLTQFFLKKTTFVLITDNDFERESFIKYVCSRSLYKKPVQEIIFCFNCSELFSETSITDTIFLKMKLGSEFTTAAVEEVLKRDRCLILLDGVDDLKITTTNSNNKRALNKIFKSSYCFENFQNLRCVVLSNSRSNWKNVVPQSSCVVKFHHPSPDNVAQLVSDILRFYGKSPEKINDSSNESIKENVKDGNDELSKTEKSSNENISQQAKLIGQQIVKETNMLKEFDLSPLFTVLVFHAMISEISKKSVKIQDFYLCRRSYLARIILLCLEFLYSQTNKQRSEFNNLKTKLGNASCPNELGGTQFSIKSKLKSKFKEDELQKIIGESDCETVFKIGLLKFQKLRDESGEVDTKRVGNSVPHNVIVFCHDYIQEYIVAKIILSDEEKLKQFLSSSFWYKDRQMMRVLQMIYGIKVKYRAQLLKMLKEANKWDILIDCLFESENTEDVKTLKPTGAGIFFDEEYTVKITHLDEPYHMMAVSRFCKSLSDYKINLNALFLKGECDIQLLRQLKMPKVKSLVIDGMDLNNETDFLSILKRAFLEKLVTDYIRFMDCDLPDQLSTEGTELMLPIISKFKAVRFLVYRTSSAKVESTAGGSFSRFDELNLKTGSWEKVTRKQFFGVSVKKTFDEDV